MSDDSNVEGDENMESSDEMNSDEPVDADLNTEPQEAPVEGEGDNDWSDFEKYQVGDDTYDLTGENDYENVVKVYKLLKDDDQVVVKQDGNKIQLKDDSVGTEYVIDLGGDDNGETAEVDNGEENFDSLQESITWQDEFDPIYQLKKRGLMKADDSDIAGFGGEEIEGDESDVEDDMIDGEIEPKNHKYTSDAELDAIINPSWEDDEEDEEFLYESKTNNKNKKARKPMKESKEVLFEVDLGYTDNYQDKDPIAGLSNNEPSKKGKSWHKGVPTGTSKPWAGETKSKGEPFEKTVNEEEIPEMEETVEEGAISVSTQTARKENKTRTSNVRREHLPQVSKNVSTAANGYEEIVNENKKLKSENKALKETLLALKSNLSEAYVTNVNLGKITKLFLENTTSQAEKVDIVNRFSNEAKTVEQSNTLYESIKRELNKTATAKVNINESMSVANNNAINENIYKSNEVIKTIDLINRMKNF